VTGTSSQAPGMASGLACTLTAMVGTRLVTLAGLVVLARLLAPDDFGLVAFALAYITYVSAMGDLGTGAALIYWRSRQEDAARVTFVVGVAMGLAWLCATILLAPSIAEFFGNDAGAPVLVTLAWSIPLQALGSTHEALCRKSLRFGVWLVAELGFAIAKALISVGLALGGFGVWSLVWGHLAGHLMRTALLWAVVPWRPALAMPWDLVRPMFAYGRSIVALNVLSAIVHHSDLIVVARFLGVTALGFYQMAAKVPEMTITLLVRAVSYVLFPALSRAHAAGHDAAGTYLAALQGVALVTVPAAVGLALLAEPLVLLLFGEQWAASIPVVRVLGVVACLRSLGTPSGDLLKASGRPGVLVGLASIKAAVLIPVMVLAAGGGMERLVTSMMVVTAVLTGLDVAVACVVTHTSGRSVFGSMKAGIAGGAAVAAALISVDLVLPLRSGPPPALLSLSLVAGFSAWVCAVHVVSPDVVRQALGRGRSLVSSIGLKRRPTPDAAAFVDQPPGQLNAAPGDTQ